MNKVDRLLEYSKDRDYIFNMSNVYREKISQKGHSEVELEDIVFNNFSEKQRLTIEVKRLSSYCSKYPELSRFKRYIAYLEGMIRLSSFDSTLIDEIKDCIVLMDMELDLPVRLYSSLPRLISEFEKSEEIKGSMGK